MFALVTKKRTLVQFLNFMQKSKRHYMKKIILCTLGLVAFFSATAQTPVLTPGQDPAVPAQVAHPEFIQFKENVHDFGNIRQGNPVTYIFEFKNVGDREINLINVQASCGCTAPNWKGGMYKPGETAQIAATYNAASEGQFNKTITVTTSEGVSVLTITGTVLNPAAYDEWKAKKDAEEAAKKPAETPAKSKANKSKSKSKAPKAKSDAAAPANKTTPVKETPKKSS